MIHLDFVFNFVDTMKTLNQSQPDLENKSWVVRLVYGARCYRALRQNMKFIDFPEGYSLHVSSGIYALPHGCWIVNLCSNEAPFLKAASSLVWPDGEVGFIHGFFDISVNYNYMVFLGAMHPHEERVLATKGLTFKNHPDNPQVKVLKFGRKNTWARECRHKYLRRHLEGRDPVTSKRELFAAPIPNNFPCEPGGLETDLEIVMWGIMGKKLGIGFFRKDAGGRFIQPDESKNWGLACLSVDELTCLAAHNYGAAIIDTPV